MPNLRNAEKALRQNKKRAIRNKTVKAEIHSLRVSARKAIESRDMESAVKATELVSKKLDKAVQKNIVKLNTAARLKSRLMKKVNALKKA